MIKEIVENMGTKLGEHNDLISDDIANLYNFENDMNNSIANKDKEIAELKKRNETLTSVNANLLKSIPVSTQNEKITTPTEADKEEPISWKDCFDSKGNFKR